jgi:hypothetical protein
LREAHEQIEASGTQLIAVAVKAPYQAQHLTDDGMPFPLLLDPEDKLRNVLGIDRMKMTRLSSPKGALAYAKALKHVGDFTIKLSEATQRPGCILLDAEQQVVWKYIGNQLGDYPPIDELLRQVSNEL